MWDPTCGEPIGLGPRRYGFRVLKGEPKMIELEPFQKRFVANATKPKIDRAAFSLPRGNGKPSLRLTY